MTLNDLQSKSVAMVGFEATNRALFAELRRRFPILPIEIRDARTATKIPNDAHVTSRLGDDYLNNLDAFDVIIRSPGVRYWPELETLRPRVTTSTNLFFEEVRSTTRAKIIAVTGTKGKSTTASLIAHMLATAGRSSVLIGNIDVQEWDHLGEVTNDTWIVYEMSSYMLEDFSGWPDIAVMVSAFPDHLDWHGDYTNYINTKANIAARQSKDDLFIFHALYDDLVLIAKHTKAFRLPVKVMKGLHWDGEWFYDDREEILPTATLKLPGAHNRDNALMALAVAKSLEIPYEIVGKAFASFQPLEHRLETVTTINDVTYVDDAISTTPESTMAAIRSCSESLPSFQGGIEGDIREGVLPPVGSMILGGLDRGYDYDALTTLITTRTIPHVILFPGGRDKIKTSLLRAGYHGTVHEADTMEQAVTLCAAHTPTHHTCLLSTAAPSYDLFTDFKDKGNRFRKAARGLTP